MTAAVHHALLVSEAQALRARLRRLRPLSTEETRVATAEVDPRALLAIERHVSRRIGRLSRQLHAFAPNDTAAQGQRVLSQLRIRFNLLLSDYDIFADALTQRSEPTHGVWLAGLDALAEDALAVEGFETPALVCYLDRGRGAAIRRARTRLPTGSLNPVAVVRLPRERLVGSGIASSLFHEVGHQGAALLGLVDSIRPALLSMAQRTASRLERAAWQLWSRWVSEIVADVWAVARAGVSAPVGLISVVGLPAPFVFRITPDDPHPSPWIRVLLSIALGAALYPALHWRQLADTWRAWYPLESTSEQARTLLEALEETLPSLAQLLLSHRVARAAGRTVASLLSRPELNPAELNHWGEDHESLKQLRPSLAIAAVGLARLEQRIDAEEEAERVDQLLHHWAVRRHFRRLQKVDLT